MPKAGTGTRGTPLIANWENQTPYSLKMYDLGVLKKEYTRVRDIARKRIERLNKAGLLTPAQYRNMQSQIPKLRDMKQASIYSALAGAYRFLAAPSSTVRGRRLQRTSSIQNLKLLGVTNINNDNADQYFMFLDEASAMEVDGKAIGSAIALQFLAEVSSREEVLEDLMSEFEEWIKDEDNYV